MFEKDYKRGTNNEKRVLPIINKVFQTTFKKTENPFDEFDFYCFSSKTMLEVKSICYNYGEKPEVMIGLNKIQYAVRRLEQGWDVWLLFSLKDGDYLYNFTDINVQWIRSYVGRPDRYNSKKTEYYWIPIDKLIKVEEDMIIALFE